MDEHVTYQKADVSVGRTRAEDAYTSIKQEIVRCALTPGSQVTEAQLADSYGFGRAAVRTALNRLYQDRLVQPIPRKGYVIAPITLKGVQNLYEVRLLLEPAAARLAAQHSTKQTIQSLSALNEQTRELRYEVSDLESISRFLKLNFEFHTTVARMSQNERLSELVAAVLDEMERLLHFGFMLSDAERFTFHQHHDIKHDELIAALTAGDEAAAKENATEQIVSSRERVIAALLQSSSLQSVSLTIDRGDRSEESEDLKDHIHQKE